MKFHAKQALGLGVLKPRKEVAKRRSRKKAQRHGERGARIDDLPDPIISCILSKLGAAEQVAVASTVCRRWNSCARYVKILRFETGHEAVENWGRQGKALGWIQIIHRTPGIRTLRISSSGYPWDYNREMYILMCIVQATPEVRVFDFDLSLTIRAGFLDTVAKFKKLETLNLSNSADIVAFFPGTKQLTSLKRCSLCGFRIMDGLLQEFVELCPVLEVLSVLDCDGMESPTIKSQTLKEFTFRGWDSSGEDDGTGPVRLRIDAPNLQKLSLDFVEEVICDGCYIEELHIHSRIDARFTHLPKLRVFNINWFFWPQHDQLLRLLEEGSSAKQVTFGNSPDHGNREKLPAEKTFGPVTQVEKLELRGFLSSMLVFPDEFCFPRLKRLTLWFSFSDAALVEFMLRSSPALEYLRLYVDSSFKANKRCVSYIRDLLKLRPAYPAVIFDLQLHDEEQNLWEGLLS